MAGGQGYNGLHSEDARALYGHYQPGITAWFVRAVLVMTDLGVLVCCFMASVLLRKALGGAIAPSYYWDLLPVVLVFPMIYALLGTYPGYGIGPVEELRKLSLGTSLVFLILAASSFLLRTRVDLSRGVYLVAWMCSLILVPLGRSVVRRVLQATRWWGEPVIILGAGKTGRMIADALMRSPGLGLRPIALLDDNPLKHGAYGSLPVVGGLEVAAAAAGQESVQHAIVAMPGLSRAKLLDMLTHHLQGFRTVTVIPELFGLPSLWVTSRDLDGILGLEIRNQLLIPSARRLKRAMDLVVSAMLLVVISPVLLLIALAIKLDSRGPVLYRHRRIGKGGRYFEVLKFRTMVKDADQVLARYLEERPELREEWVRDQKLKQDPRVTRIGRVLRRLSLDELPQLINVLRGEMSLVGPRPIVSDEVQHYGSHFSLYTAVSPGMTGLWQVSGRSDVSYSERVRLDSYYVRNWSVWLDLYILARTIPAILSSKGAY